MRIQLKQLLNAHPIKHAISIALTLLVAAYIDIFFSFSHEYWIALTAFLVSQATRGRAARQGMIVFLICLLPLIVATMLKMIILKQAILYFILSFIFILGDYVVYLNRLFSNKFLLIVIFILIWLIAGLPPSTSAFMLKDKILDVMIGAMIGLIGAQSILPVKLYDQFRQGVVPILKTLANHAKRINDYFKQDFKRDDHVPHDLITYKKLMQKTLHQEESSYPEWVYESGFNRELRSGYRFFLVHLEWITEIFVSINALLFDNIDGHSNSQAITLLNPALTLSMEKNQELIEILIQYFKEGKIKDKFWVQVDAGVTNEQSDFKTDMLNLENTLKQHIPGSIELLDISPEYMVMTALVKLIKDLRALLLELLVSLPSNSSQT